MKILFLLILLLFVVDAKDIIDLSKIKTTTIHSYQCKKGKAIKFCLDKKIEYPKISTLTPKIRKILLPYIQKLKSRYKEEDFKTYLEDIDLDSTDRDDIEYYFIGILDIDQYHYPFLVLSYLEEGFSGGAHGYNYAEFYNYDIKRGKKLKLNDFLKVNSKLLKIIEYEYRKSRGLLPEESLSEYAGWYEDKFKLTDNFEILKDSLYFLYNVYEVTPRVSEPPDFYVPYYKIKRYIRKEYRKYLIFKKSKNIILKREFSKGEIFFKIKKFKNLYRVSVKVKFKNKPNNSVWLSISFPNLDSKYIKSYKSSAGKIKLYKKGSKIYSKNKKALIKSKYPLLEVYSKKRLINTTFTIAKDKKIPYICINYRLNSKKEAFLDYEYDNFYDQQGFMVNRLCF